MLGTGRYTIEVADTGAEGARNPAYQGIARSATTLRFGLGLDAISAAQVTIDLPSSAEAYRQINTIWSELRIIRDGRIVWEGVIVRKEVTRKKISLMAFDVLWWTQRRFVRDSDLDGSLADVAQIVQSILNASVGRFRNGRPMDPAVMPFARGTTTGVFAQPEIVNSDRRMAFDEIQTWVKTALDITVVKRAILWGDPPMTDRFPTIRLEHIVGEPSVVERGDLYVTDVEVTGEDGVSTAVASVESVLGLKVPPHLRCEHHEVAESVSDEVGLQEIADQLIGHRYPAPVELVMDQGAYLSPSCPASFDQLAPGMRGLFDLSGISAAPRAQESKITSVSVRASTGSERVSVDLEPVGHGHGLLR